jgi:ADP-ribosylglycohydrolase
LTGPPGALVGLPAGDALGAGYEFDAPPPANTARMIGGGLGNWAPGEWTDDTQMAYCIAIQYVMNPRPGQQVRGSGCAERRSY